MIVYYAHGGSDNHGCEAIIRGTHENLSQKTFIYSGNMRADVKYGLDRFADIDVDAPKRYRHAVKWFLGKVSSRLFGTTQMFSQVDGKREGVYLSVGGDNYCYPNLIQPLVNANKRIRTSGRKTVLWGTSIEPEVLHDENVLQDLMGYNAIFARESITYNALLKTGVLKHVYLYPDPAFAMLPSKISFPDGFIPGNTIGINISPLILNYSPSAKIVRSGYLKIIEWILNNTKCNIALIPHVVKRHNDDRQVIESLLSEINNERVIGIEDHSAPELKFLISKCTFFIGARTHSTIAAYSQAVPTLVVGYSVKARGIAQDLFGTSDKFVVDVRELTDPDVLLSAFVKLFASKDEIRMALTKKMDSYIPETEQAVVKLKEVIGE